MVVLFGVLLVSPLVAGAQGMSSSMLDKEPTGLAVMTSGSTDAQAVSRPSLFIMVFSSMVYIKRNCSFDSVSESHQLLLCLGFEESL